MVEKDTDSNDVHSIDSILVVIKIDSLMYVNYDITMWITSTLKYKKKLSSNFVKIKWYL